MKALVQQLIKTNSVSVNADNVQSFIDTCFDNNVVAVLSRYDADNKVYWFHKL